MFDIYDDTKGEILSKLSRIPEFVKSASHIPGEDGRNTKNIFAWKEAKRFPIDTPADIWLSARYFEKVAHTIPKHLVQYISDNIKLAATLRGMDIKSIIDPQEETNNEIIKNYRDELPDEAFALTLPIENIDTVVTMDKMAFVKKAEVNKLRMYPIIDEYTTTQSNQYFPNNLDNGLEYFRPKVAQRIKEACEKFNIKPSNSVIKEASVTRSSLNEQLLVRRSLAKDQNIKQAYQLLIDKLNSNDLDSDSLMKYATFFDNKSGMNTLYGSHIAPSFIFGASIIDAPKHISNVKVANSQVSMQDLLSISKEILNDLSDGLGNYASAEKLASDISSLPKEKQFIIKTLF